tara:strand:- start:1397 stop:1552 length:156 start_codon:yes stop_codon:yes gene_type:complete
MNITNNYTLLLVSDMDWSEYDTLIAEDVAEYEAGLAADAEAERMFGDSAVV